METKKIKINGFEITHSFSDKKSDDYILNKTIAEVILDNIEKIKQGAGEDERSIA